MTRVSAFPGLSFAELYLKPEQFSFKSIFPKRKINYYYRGASAVYHAVKALSLGADDVILAPSYHCGVEIEAILRTGVQIRYFNVDEKLNAEINSVQENITPKTKALFVIHYYGFAQPLEALRKICAEKKIFLIEDCAHALYSRGPDNRFLGDSADAAIFSFQKTLPVADGGALVSQSPVDPAPLSPNHIATFRGLTLLRIAHLKMHQAMHYFILDWIFLKPVKCIWQFLKKMLGQGIKVNAPNSMELDEDTINTTISRASYSLIRKFNPEEIVKKRRENFSRLQRALTPSFANAKSGFNHDDWLKPLFQNLPEGVCPLFFPVITREREHLRGELTQKGIETFIFGEHLHPGLPRAQFPNARFLADHVLCLPIHQGLTPKHIEYMASVISFFASTKIESA
jgi:dTDP-4-amino-4,6-dideoxygalactose transaminase